MCTKLAKVTCKSPNNSLNNPVLAFDYSGGYYNPVLATGLKWGCKGHTNVEHIIVYWIGASIGAIASIYVYPIVKNLLAVKAKNE